MTKATDDLAPRNSVRLSGVYIAQDTQSPLDAFMYFAVSSLHHHVCSSGSVTAERRPTNEGKAAELNRDTTFLTLTQSSYEATVQTKEAGHVSVTFKTASHRRR